MKSEHKRVYRNWSPTKAALMSIMGLGLVISQPVLIGFAVRDGGMTFGGGSTGGSGEWVAAPIAVPFLCVMDGLILLLIVRTCLDFNRPITLDDMGITQTDLFGKVNRRIRWDQITGVSEDLRGNTVVSTSSGPWLLDNRHEHVGAILAEIREHTGLTPQ